MFRSKLTCNLLQNLHPVTVNCRGIQVSIIGAANEVASNVAMLLKHSELISRMNLFDDDERVKGVAAELCQIPGRPAIHKYYGDVNLASAIDNSRLILMLDKTINRPGNTLEQDVAINSIAIKKLCRTIADRNPNAFLAVSTNPINAIIPLVSSILYKHHVYNPQRIFGITNIDSVRSRSLAAQVLKLSPGLLKIPIIGGHSTETMIPLFSNVCPPKMAIESGQANMLTRMVRKAPAEVMLRKTNSQPDILAMAWSISEFVDWIIRALQGERLILNCFCANPHFGTRYFAGPCVVGPEGIESTCKEFALSNLEANLLEKALPVLTAEIGVGERCAFNV